MKIIKEASFKSGSASKVLKKVLVVIGKRVGVTFALSPIPWGYKNAFGYFEGYYAFYGNNTAALRVNFEIGKSDKILSVDWFETLTKKPKFTIELNGLNIVEVVDTITSVMDGTYQTRAEMTESVELAERYTTKDAVEDWFMEDPNILRDMQSGRMTWTDVWEKFEAFVQTKDLRVPAKDTAIWNIKQHVKNNRITINVKSARVSAGVTETPVVTDTDSAEQFGVAVIENVHLKKFGMMESNLRMIGAQNDMINSLLIYGQAGIGKSHMVKKVFKDMGLTVGRDYVIKSGGIAGKTGLRQLLWDYREGYIIVLDDNDAILKNQDGQNMLKAALQDSDRVISYTQARRVTSESVINEDLDLSDDDFAGDPPEGFEDRPMVQRSDPNGTGPIPDDFEFKSKMVFISNLMDFPAAIKSRCISVKIDMTVDQTLELIKANLTGVMAQHTEITIDMKMEVFEFLVDNARSIQTIDYRQFGFAMIPYMGIVLAGGNPTTDTSWQDSVLIQMTS